MILYLKLLKKQKDVCDVINFEINLSFFIKPSSYMIKTSGEKCEYPKNEKKPLGRDKKHFSSFLKVFQLSEIVSDSRVAPGFDNWRTSNFIGVGMIFDIRTFLPFLVLKLGFLKVICSGWVSMTNPPLPSAPPPSYL